MENKDILATLGENPSRRDILAHWEPENEVFWKRYGERIAKQNLYTSTFVLTLAFVAWTMWATLAPQLNSVGFHFSDNEIFTLAALPGLVGATGRLIYTYLPAILGGRNWTLISTAALLIPLIGLGDRLPVEEDHHGPGVPGGPVLVGHGLTGRREPLDLAELALSAVAGVAGEEASTP